MTVYESNRSMLRGFGLTSSITAITPANRGPAFSWIKTRSPSLNLGTVSLLPAGLYINRATADRKIPGGAHPKKHLPRRLGMGSFHQADIKRSYKYRVPT